MDGSEPNVFISYARSDGRLIAERLLTSLVKRGIDAWYDKRDLDPFQDYSAEIEDGIERSSHVAVCVTTGSKRDASFVRREITYASAIKKRIVPLRFENIPPPIQIVTHTWIDFLGDWDVAFAEFLERLHRPPADDDESAPPEDPFHEHLTELNQYVVRELRRSVLNVDAILALRASGDPETRQRTIPIAYQSRAPGWFNEAVEDTAEPETRTFESFRDAFDHHDRRTVLLGQPGGGKTTTLLAFARDAVARRLADPHEPLPVFAPIRSWAGSDVVSWLANAVGVDDARLRAEVQAGRALLLLDGLDELRGISFGAGEADPRRSFLQALRDAGPTPVVVTSRIAEWEAFAATTQGVLELPASVRLMPMRDEEIATYLAGDADLLAALMSDRALLELARNPLLLTLLALAYRDEGDAARQLRGLSDSPVELRARIFTKYIERRYTYESLRTGPDAPLRFGLEDVYEFLGAAAMDLLDRFQRIEVEIRDNGYSVTYGGGGTIDLVEVDVRSLRQLFGALAIQLISFAERLNLLARVRDGWVRFAHLLLRDHFAVPRAIEQMTDEDPDLRARAAGILGLAGDQRAVPHLLTALDDPDPKVRAFSVWALGETRDPAAVQALARLADPTESTNVDRLLSSFALRALGRIGIDGLPELEHLMKPDPTRSREVVAALEEIGPPAVPALIRALDGLAEREAAEALGRIRDPAATDALIEHLESGWGWGKLQALGNIGDPKAVPFLLRFWDANHDTQALEAIAAIGGSEAAAALSTALHDQDGARRAQVASAIGRLDGPEATPALVMALADPDLRVRGAAAEALDRAGYDDVVLAARRPSTDELLAALRGQDIDIRVEAARRLGSHARADVADALAGAVGDDHAAVGRAAVFALAELGDARAIAPLAEILFEEPFDLGAIDGSVASALAKIPEPEAVRALIPALDSEDWEFEGTRDTIRSLGGIAVAPLVAALPEVDWEFRRTVASVLGSIGAPAIPEVVALLQTDLRDLAAEVLTAIGEPAIQPVAERLEAGSTEERGAALATLGGIGSSAVVDHIAAVLRSDPELTDPAANALSEVGEPAVSTLIEALGHERPDVRRRAAGALGEIGDPRALGPLDAVLDDPDAGVRWHALLALGEIAEPSAEASVRRLVDDPDVIVRLTARRLLELPDGGPVEPELVAALRSSDPDLMAGAGALLAQRDLVDPLIEALRSDEPSVSLASEAALRGVEDKALAPLGELGAGPDGRLRLAAARILAERGDIEAIRYLSRTLAEEDRDDRDEIIELILRVPQWTGPELLAGLHDPLIGEIAADLLTRMGSIAVAPALDLLATGDERDQAVATDILVGIGRPAVRPLIEFVQPDQGAEDAVGRRAVEALGAIGGPRAVTVLSVIAENAYEEDLGKYAVEVRLAAVSALATNLDPLARARLRRVTETKNRKVRKAALEALG